MPDTKLNPVAQALLQATKKKKADLHQQIAELRTIAEELDALVNWLQSPWNYGDVVEETAKPGKEPRRYVVVNALRVGADGHNIKRNGTLSKATQYVYGECRLVGQYHGEDLPAPPKAAAVAAKVKQGLTDENKY